EKCSVCGEVLAAQQTVAATGHTEVIDAAVAPTCTETGLTEGKHCSVCNAILAAQTTVSATGHSYDSVVTAPTCTADGYTTFTCSACGDTYDGEKKPATGHSYTAVVTAPTCTAEGYTTYTCSCGHSYKADYTDKVPHAMGEWRETVAPTYENNGEKRRDCENCDYFETETIGMLSHNYVAVVTAPTCTTDGYTTYTCTDCGDSYVGDHTPAKGHRGEILPAVLPTCTETGLTAGEKCSVCGEVLAAQQTVAATGHTEVIDAAVAPTCTETGLTEGRHCSVCNAILAAQTTVSATGHSYASVVTAPTCTAEGYTTHTCTKCDHTYTDSQTPAKGHTEQTLTAVPPTCTEDGFAEGVKCAVCGEILTSQGWIPATGHSYGSVVMSPTCTTGGYTTHTCSVCGHAYTDSEVTATGHTEVVIPAVASTCTEEGLTEGTKCSVCDEIITAQQTVPATGHTNETIPAVAPTCTETGMTEGVKCSVCHAVLETQHTVLALGHTEEIIPAVNATCTASGLTAGKKCSVCGEVLAAQQTIPATGHTYTAVVTPASCGERGYTTHTCNICGDVRVDSFVEVRDHEYEGGNCVYCGLTHSDYFTFTELADGTYSVKMANKSSMPSNVVLPSVYNYTPVTQIEKNGFANCT
ncbi:MAG: hypothetical protein J6M42_00825, partial [Clostridia bacterium]|nr:hypothetical protein [Clostridia bacterium]